MYQAYVKAVHLLSPLFYANVAADNNIVSLRMTYTGIGSMFLGGLSRRIAMAVQSLDSPSISSLLNAVSIRLLWRLGAHHSRAIN